MALTPVPKSVAAPPAAYGIKPATVLLQGPPGSGKSWSLSTIIEAGLELFVVGTEPNYLDSILDAMKAKKLPIDKLHWHSIQPANPGWDGLKSMATSMNNMGYDDLTKIKSADTKKNTRQAIELLQTLADFVDERTGEAFGDVTKFDGRTQALAIDSLSGINVMSMDLHLGLKPVAHQGEWGAVMNFEEKLIQTLTSQLNCLFVLTAHVEKEPNELTGGNEITVSALGRKLAPKIGRWFSEIILTKKDPNGKFLWSNRESNAALKNRSLEYSDKLDPSFLPLWKAHLARMESAQ